MKLYLILLTVLITPIVYGQNRKECIIDFSSVGFYNFSLGVNMEQLLKENPYLKLRKIKDNINSLDSYYYEISEDSIVYYFNFKQDILTGYFFEIPGSIEKFRELARKLSINNDFIDDSTFSKLYYNSITSDCSKYFGVKIKEDKSFIIGGIDYRYEK